jgi:hypothetical protein
MMNFVAVFLGCVIYILLQLNGVYTSPDFKWGVFAKTNWIPTVLNLLVGVGCVIGKEEIVNIYPITFVSAMMLGLAGQAFIKKLSNVFDSKVNTIVSL